MDLRLHGYMKGEHEMEKPKLTRTQIILLDKAFSLLANCFHGETVMIAAISELRNLVFDQFSNQVR